MKLNLLPPIALLVAMTMSTAHAGIESHGGDAVVTKSKVPKVSLLDSHEFDYEFMAVFSDDPKLFQDLEQKRFLLAARLGIQLPRSDDLVWARTKAQLENIRDEGAIRTGLEGKLAQAAIQRDRVVVIQGALFDAMSPGDRVGLILHEILIAGALEEQLNLAVPEIGTSPIRELVWLAQNPAAKNLPAFLFQNSWKKLPSRFGIVQLDRDTGSFTILDPRVPFGSSLLPIDRVFYRESDKAAAWCGFFGKKLKLGSGGYDGTYTSDSPFNIPSLKDALASNRISTLTVTTGVTHELTKTGDLLFGTAYSMTVLTSLSCRRVQ
ncbi:MAG: hypothetical protein HUU37_01845 [Bdellovibrionales bacterium]|nr:hypothetical protein [Bdellovibrionales bacterium]